MTANFLGYHNLDLSVNESVPEETLNARKIRFKSLDFLKGLGLIIILEAHLGLWYQSGTWHSSWAITQIITRPGGPANFILVSILGLLISFFLRQESVNKRHVILRVAKRSLIFLFIGSILNIINIWQDIVATDVFFVYKLLRVLFTCNIFTFLGWAQLITCAFKDLKKSIQIAFIVATFAFYYIALPFFIEVMDNRVLNYRMGDLYLYSAMPTEISGTLFVYFMMFFENSMAPFIPWVGLVFLVNAVYGEFARAIRHQTQPSDLLGVLKRIQKYSLICIGVGVGMGFAFSPGLMNQVEYSWLVNDASAIRFWDPSLGGYPLFLHQNNPAYILFAFGLMSFFTSSLIMQIDIKQRWRTSRFIKTFSVFGKYSMTVFITHALASFIPLTLSFPEFLLVLALASTFYISIIYLWHEKFHGIGSLSWAMRIMLSGEIMKKIRAVEFKKVSLQQLKFRK